MSTSSGQGRERDFINSTTNTSFSKGFFSGYHRNTIHEGSIPIFIIRESQGFRKSQLDSTPNQKRSPNPNRRTDSPVGRLVDPVLRSIGRSTGTNRNRMSASRSTASVDRSPCHGRRGYVCARCARQSTGRSARLCPGLL